MDDCCGCCFGCWWEKDESGAGDAMKGGVDVVVGEMEGTSLGQRGKRIVETKPIASLLFFSPIQFIWADGVPVNLVI